MTANRQDQDTKHAFSTQHLRNFIRGACPTLHNPTSKHFRLVAMAEDSLCGTSTLFMLEESQYHPPADIGKFHGTLDHAARGVPVVRQHSGRE